MALSQNHGNRDPMGHCKVILIRLIDNYLQSSVMWTRVPIVKSFGLVPREINCFV